MRIYGMIVVAALAGLLSGCAQQDAFEQRFSRERFTQVAALPLPEGKPLDKEAEMPVSSLFADPNGGELGLSLEQCRAMALQNNLGLKAEMIGPQIAAASVRAEEAKFEAAFFTNVNYTKTDSPTATRLSGSKVDAGSVSTGVQMPMQTGGELTFTLADDRVLTNNEFSLLNPAYSNDFSVSISQPLLRNGGQRVNLHSIRVAKYDKQIIDARTKLEVIRVLAATERVYWRLYAARKVLTVRQQQYDLAQAQLERAKRFVDAGTHAPIEILRAEAGLATQLEGIILAENDLRDRQRELKQTLQQKEFLPDSTVRLRPETEPDPVRYELDKTALVKLAEVNRMELLEAELQIAKQVSTIDYLRNQALPVVNLDYTYNVNGLGATRGDSFDLLNEKNFEDHRIGVQLLVPLGNAAAKNRLMGAFYQRAQILADTESRRSLIELEVLNAADRVEANWQRILAGRQNTLLQARLYEAELRQFELGLRTSTDVLIVQTQLSEAQRAEIGALAEYQISLVDAAWATGTSMGAAKIELENDSLK